MTFICLRLSIMQNNPKSLSFCFGIACLRAMNTRLLGQEVHSSSTIAIAVEQLLREKEGFLLKPEGQTKVTFDLKKDGQPVHEIDALIQTGFTGVVLVSYLLSHGISIEFNRFESDAFTYNLRMIDALKPDLLGAMVIEACRFKGEAPTVATVIDVVSQDAVVKRHAVLSRMGVTARQRKAVLTYKMKQLLMALVLGMRTDEPWDGIERMPGEWAGRFLARREVEEALVSRVRLKLNEEEGQRGALMVGENGLLCWTAHLSMWC